MPLSWGIFCPAGFEPLLFLALRAGLFLAPGVRGRSGLVRPHALRPEIPPAATELGRPAVGTPRCSPQAAPATPHRGSSARCPQPPEPWPLAPPGRIDCPPPAREYASSNPVILRPSAARPKDPMVPGRRIEYPPPAESTLTASQRRLRIRPAIKRPQASPCRVDCRLGELHGA